MESSQGGRQKAREGVGREGEGVREREISNKITRGLANKMGEGGVVPSDLSFTYLW